MMIAVAIPQTLLDLLIVSVIPLLAVITAILKVVLDRMTIRLAKIEEQNDGIITGLNKTVETQISDAAQLAVVTDLKTKIVEAEHNPAK